MSKFLLFYGFYWVASSMFAEDYLISNECNKNLECKQYSRALKITKTPTKQRIYKYLTPIRESTKSLKFDSERRVLLVTSNAVHNYSYTEGDTIILTQDTWFTAYPDLQNSCKNYENPNKSYRMIQQLGLSPKDTIADVNEFFVNLNDIFRPCPDPDITDMECLVNVLVLNKNSTSPQVPWFCPQKNEKIEQVGQKWAKVSESHFEWMCDNWIKSFENKDIYDNYPWTGLGYTFDWGTEHGIGLSEFVVPKGTSVLVHKKTSVNDYCK